jgi:hypothetical protein
MSNRLLKEGILDRFFSLFLKAKAQNKESQWLSKIRQQDPEMADIWSKWDTETNSLLRQSRDSLKAAGGDTSKLDALIKKYS